MKFYVDIKISDELKVSCYIAGDFNNSTQRQDETQLRLNL